MNRHDFEIAINKANKILKQINEKYSGLKGKLVFASPPGETPWNQYDITSDIITILKEFPQMICESVDKEAAAPHADIIRQCEKVKVSNLPAEKKKDADLKIEKAVSGLIPYLDKLELRDDILVEIRFDRLLYDLIFELQKDPLVSQKYTPQTRASIRIVLGTIGELYQSQRNNDDVGTALP